MMRSKWKFLPLRTAAIIFTTVLAAAPRALAGPPGWVQVSGAMSSPRALAVAAALPNGQVLVIGGQDSTGAVSAAVDVYDSQTKAWLAPAASMHVGRFLPAMTVLHDGRVLVAGGEDASGNILATAEIYDPATNAWTLTADMPYGDVAGAAVTLQDGRVLLAGGLDGSSNAATAGTLIFDPSTGVWTAGSAMGEARYFGTATLLNNGTVLVAGGTDGTSSPLLPTDLFDPSTNTWSAAGPMSTGHVLGVSGLLPDGRVIVAGGSATSDITTQQAAVDIYDPATGQWQAAAPMSTPRGLAGGGVAVDGTFVVGGGLSGYDPNTGAAILPATSEAYHPTTGLWTAAGAIPSGVAYPASASVNGQVLLAGGLTSNSAFGDAGLVYVSQNHPPVAVASVPATVQGVAGGESAVPVSAAGSSDPDNDPLTFVWSEGATTLATTADPVRTATLALGVGVHTLTLTVSDGYGGVSTTTVTVTVVDATAGLQAQIAQLTTELQQTQAQLAAAEQAAANAVGTIQARLQTLFHDPSFLVPGGDPAAQLNALVQAVVHLKRDCQLELYRELKPPVHHRRDGDHDRDGDDHGRGGHARR
ncbi:MAG: hypothetical protein KGN76_08795 [Acidobacteriota bacterium]|nr:hypothetical protein [Acidobacteriota bacterium]